MVDGPEKTLSVKERLALQKNTTEGKKEEVISCSEVRPICLNRPRGKLTQKDGKNTLIHPKMIVDCLGEPYTPAMGLDYLLESFNEKKIFSRKSDQKDAFCYQMDLAWYMIFNDIILNIDDITVKMIEIEIEIEKKKTEVQPIENVPEEEPPMAKVIDEAVDMEQFEIDAILTIEEAEEKGIDFYILFTKLIDYGGKKWEMEKVMEDYKECDAADCPYLTANKKNKNDCIAFIILNKIRELINDKGFKVFSSYIKSPLSMPEINNSTKASDILKAINDVFKLSFFIMNNKTDLTNVYNNQEIETIYTEINEKTKQIKGVFDVYAQIDTVTKSGGGKGKDALDSILGVTLMVIGTLPWTALLGPFILGIGAAGGALIGVGLLCFGLIHGTGRLISGAISGVKHLFDSKETKEKRRILEESKKIAKEQKKEDIKKYMNYISFTKHKIKGEFKDVFIGTYNGNFGIYTLDYYRARGKDGVIFYEYNVELVGKLMNPHIISDFMEGNNYEISFITEIINNKKLRKGHEDQDRMIRRIVQNSLIESLDKKIDDYKVKGKKNLYNYLSLFLFTDYFSPWEKKKIETATFKEITDKEKGITGGRKSHRVKHKTRERKNIKNRKTKQSKTKQSKTKHRKTKKNTYNR
jgi:hypothetical protein